MTCSSVELDIDLLDPFNGVDKDIHDTSADWGHGVFTSSYIKVTQWIFFM